MTTQASQSIELPELPTPYTNVDPICAGNDRPLFTEHQMVNYARKAIAAQTPPAVPILNNSGEVPIAPDHCPITGREFWGNIDHPKLGMVATYGGPFDTYTIPKPDEDGEFRCERFDQDAGDWVEGGHPTGLWLADEQPDAAPPQAIAAVTDSDMAVIENALQHLAEDHMDSAVKAIRRLLAHAAPAQGEKQHG
jgi:hypothetical protein